MNEYIFEGELNGVSRKLTLMEQQPNSYAIYWDSFLLGVLFLEYNIDSRKFMWQTNKMILLPFVDILGDYIEKCKFEENE